MKEAVHVYPLNDLKEHYIQSSVSNGGVIRCGCDCRPGVKYHNGEVIIVHNSFDGREGVELAKAILNG